jgi:hypothetical protein
MAMDRLINNVIGATMAFVALTALMMDHLPIYLVSLPASLAFLCLLNAIDHRR